MFKKTVLALTAAAVVAGSALSVSATSAAAGEKERNFVAGAVLGLATGIIVDKAFGHDGGYRKDHRKGYREEYREVYVKPGYGKRHVRPVACEELPIVKWSRKYQQKIVVGYETVCR